ncbi:uncharacterized protein C8orf88 homolog [Danio rerio]|uniref:Granulito n=1 Tax=Danio rerio TaxID=7955 RepID=B3DKF4_DANRE|nr:uncharacterized protein C8orf88 homolog [Danio rerio]AAI63829.1 Granulito [Danio rerio]AAI63839.1 Granulito [Danio rerio]|eukprot:NP_001094418.2 uncharacterized protein C8orf88 homolog [Danio rerio]
MTEAEDAVNEAWSFEHIKMDVSKRIVRHLEPARPLRRFRLNQVPQSYAETRPIEKPDNIITVENFYEILHLKSTETQQKKKVERICYTRDFLVKMANSPMSKEKPEFLPDHPVVLKNGRPSDLPRYFSTSYNNNNYKHLSD